jgi:hypothetical protein
MKSRVIHGVTRPDAHRLHFLRGRQESNKRTKMDDNKENEDRPVVLVRLIHHCSCTGQLSSVLVVPQPDFPRCCAVACATAERPRLTC